MLFFIFHLISITMLSNSLPSSWADGMVNMEEITKSSCAKSKCAEYIINSNIRKNDLVVIWRWDESKVIGHSLIQRIMRVANVLIASEYKIAQVWRNYSWVDAVLPKHTRHMPEENESFTHRLNKGNVFIIETNISSCDRAIASISKSTVYNSRANFILLLSTESHDTVRTLAVVDTQSCEKEIKSKNHSHNAEQSDADNNNTFNNSTRPKRPAVDHKINDEKMIHGTLRHVFHLLWSRHIFNAVIMLCETIDTPATMSTTKTTSTTSTTTANAQATVEVCSFYTWFPFDESSKCGQCIEHFVKIDECVYDKIRNYLQFHYAKENKWYFGVSDDEQCQINNRRHTDNDNAEPENNNIKPSRRNGNHFPNEKKIFVGNVAYTFAYTFQTNKNFINNISMFNVHTENSTEYEMNISNFGHHSNVDSIDQFNLCYSKATNPSVRLFMINETLTHLNRERAQNQEFATNYFKYEYREFGTIEFRKNRPTIPNNHIPAYRTEANTTKSPSIIVRIISNPHRPHFYEKIPSDLLGCVYDTFVIVWPPFVTPVTAAFYGLEHKLLLDVARHMHYQMNETYKQFGNAIQEGRKTKYSYGILVNSSASFVFGNIYPVANMHNKYDASIGYLYDHVNWAVPLATAAPAWLNLFNCFR